MVEERYPSNVTLARAVIKCRGFTSIEGENFEFLRILHLPFSTQQGSELIGFTRHRETRH